MSLLELFEHGERKSLKGHFRNLLMIAQSDGKVCEEENAFLTKIAGHLGLTSAQVDEIRAHPERYPMMPPVDFEERRSRSIDLVELLAADGEIDQLELSVLYRFSAGLGFPDERMAQVVDHVINGLREKKDRSQIIEELDS